MKWGANENCVMVEIISSLKFSIICWLKTKGKSLTGFKSSIIAFYLDPAWGGKKALSSRNSNFTAGKAWHSTVVLIAPQQYRM